MNISKVFYLIAIIIAFSGCKTKCEEPQAETIKYVKVETISNGIARNKMTFSGKIKEKSLTSLSFRVGGPLAALNVKPGDFVKAGSIVAAIDKRDYELQLQTSKAQFTQAESEYLRYKQLAEQKKIPANTFERVESGYLMAKTSFENAGNQLQDTELKAPFSGYIHEKMVENYQTIGPGTPIVSLIDISTLEVVVSVSENQLQKVRNDRKSYLSVANAHVNQLPLKLLSIGEKAGPNGLYEVKFTFKNADHLKIAPGMTAEVTLLCDEKENSMSLASSAIFHENTSNYVWIYNPSTQKVDKREIKISVEGAQGRALVLSGIKSGEQVVTAGIHHLTDGQEVKPIAKPSQTNVGGLL